MTRKRDRLLGPTARTARRVLAAIALAACWAAPTGAADAAVDAADWALADPMVAAVFRGADGLADRLDTLEARFGAAPRVAEAIAALRGWRKDGIGPWARAWGPGLDLGAGLALFVDNATRVRFVVGSTDRTQALSSLAAHFARLDMPLTPTAEGFAGPMAFTCAQRGRFLVCDSQEIPQSAPRAPSDLGSGWLSVSVGGPLMTSLPAPWGLWAERIRLDATAQAGAMTLSATLTTRADARPQLAPLRAVFAPTTGRSDLGPLHDHSPAQIKISLDGPALMQLIAPPDPAVAELTARLAGLWSGDILLTFAGGAGDAVLGLGLQPGADGEALARTLGALITHGGLPTTHAPGALTWKGEDEDLPSTMRLRYRATAGHLLIGLEAIDLQRAAEGKTPPDLPPAWARRGVHGLHVSHLPIGIGALPAFIEFADPDARVVMALVLLGQLESKLLDSATAIVEPGTDSVRIDLTWSML